MNRFLASISNASPALSDKLAKNPAWRDTLSSLWDKRLSKDDLHEQLESAPIDLKNTAAVKKILRNFKYLNMIRIAAKDLNNTAPVTDLIHEWSDVADSIISKAYDAAYVICSSKFNEALYLRGAVVALGKLGGQELNMSSDVDLICLYSSDKRLSPEGDEISAHEFYTKLIATFTEILSQITQDGFAFRVDHELRPEGPKGPLVNSIDALERYYETFGRDWERIALIKARPVAGDMELGRKFLQIVKPFVWRSSLTVDDLAHLREMKARIESFSLAETTNIKTGPGGIRELEFFVQGLQQVFGGHIKALQTSNTCEAIKELRKENIIHPHAAKGLLSAYAFLRRVENMLQIEQDLQTHTLPASEASLNALALRLGYNEKTAAPKDAMISDLGHHMQFVNKLFMGLFETDYEKKELYEVMHTNLASSKNEEEKADALAWFKSKETKRLKNMDLNSKIDLEHLLKGLSLVAEVVLNSALSLAKSALIPRFGEPKKPSSFALIALGRLGSCEMDYGSDLDICFLYSGEGETSGPEKISISWFYTKLVQRIMSLVSLNSRYGRAYTIDSDLRPSGGQGPLVASRDSFFDYHKKSAKLWERLALLKAKVVAGDEPFAKKISAMLNEIAYSPIFISQDQIRDEVLNLRRRFELEMAVENENSFNLKIGRGSIADIEAIIQFLTLINAAHRPEVRVKNTFELIRALKNARIITDGDYEFINDSYGNYRRWIASLRLFTMSAVDTIDFNALYIDSLSQNLGFYDRKDLKKRIEDERLKVREFYRNFFKI